MRYDVVYEKDRCYIHPHFCREWEGEVGCYGTNPHHGFSWKEAKKEVITWYKGKIKEIENQKEDEYYD